MSNSYLGTPYAPPLPVPSIFSSITSGGLIALLFQYYSGQTLALTTTSVVSTALIATFPRLLLWSATKKRRDNLRSMAAAKLKQRDARRNTLRPIVMKDLSAEASICQLMAHELLDKMRSKELSCESVVRAFCSRALRLGEITGSVTDELYDEALARALEIDTMRNSPSHDVDKEPPLLGLPFSVKDQINVKGYDSTAGAQVRVFAPAEEDAAVVALLREAGAIPFVKSNIPQSLLITESVNNIFGRALNPWDLKRTPGGSSGGEGAILGMDASPLGIGTDIGGSIRTPALYCGITGLKPSSGRISRAGLMSARFMQRNGQEGVKSVVGPMARSVKDLVLAMQAWLVSDQKKWDFDGVQANPCFNNKLYESKIPLRVGMVISDDYFPSCSTSQRAVLEAAEALRQKGHTVVPIYTKNSDPGFSGIAQFGTVHSDTDHLEILPGFGDAFGLFAKILGADGDAHFQTRGLEGEALLDEYQLQAFLSTIPDFVRPALSQIIRLVLGERMGRMVHTLQSEMTARDYWNTLADRTIYKKRFESVFRHHNLDLLLTPGTALPAHTHGDFGKIALAVCYQAVYNVLDWTSGCLPITVVRAEEEGQYQGSPFNDETDLNARAQLENAAGLPMGVQIAAPSGYEEMVLRAMRDVEDVVAFRQKHEPKGLGDALRSRM
jgi:fatty acid amide hydrolase